MNSRLQKVSRPDTPHAQPRIIASVRDDIANWDAWLSRRIILVYAAAAGLCTVAFTRLLKLSLDAFGTL